MVARTAEVSKDIKSFLLRLPQSIHKRFKIKCVKEGVSMQNRIEELIAQDLKKD